MNQYVVCKRRNVAAAYERFLGPSAGALEEPWQTRTWTGLMRMLGRRKRRSAPMPVGFALESTAGLEQPLLVEGPPDELHGDRQSA